MPVGSSKRIARSLRQNSPVWLPIGVTFTTRSFTELATAWPARPIPAASAVTAAMASALLRWRVRSIPVHLSSMRI
jgi:hypothetical protein